MSIVATSGSNPHALRTALVGLMHRTTDSLGLLPHSAIALLARASVATTFWLSGQSKVEGFVVDPINLHFEPGIPRLAEGTVELFRTEYGLPLIPPDLAAVAAAVAEHVFPLLLVLGLASRLSALALLAMTLVIQFFVYPSAFATHGLWAVSMLYLIARGPGVLSLDHWIAGRCRVPSR